MGIYKAGADGKAQKGLSKNDLVVTNGGTYMITAVNPDGSYQSKKVMENTVYPSSYTPTSDRRASTAEDSGTAQAGYIEYLKQQAAADIERNLASLKTAYDKNMRAYEAEAATVPQQYEAARNRAAAQGAIAQRSFNEQALAAGLSGGAKAQADLTRAATATGQLAGIDRDEQTVLRDIDAARAGLTADYNNAIAQTKAAGDSALAQSLYAEMLRADEQRREDIQAQRALAENKAATLAQYGNFSGYSALGYTDAEIAVMQNAYNMALAQQAAKSTSTATSTAKSTAESTGGTKTQSVGDGALKYGGGINGTPLSSRAYTAFKSLQASWVSPQAVSSTIRRLLDSGEITTGEATWILDELGY